MEKVAQLYAIGNPWQKKVYEHMANFLSKKEVTLFGETRNGNKYKHWLTENEALKNFITPEIYLATRERFTNHKAGDLNRILTNTAASQPYCFNLIVYLQQHIKLADQLFSSLLNKNVNVQHLEPEFTPNQCDSINGFMRHGDESIGDQNGKQGTDADIAVFYNYDSDKKGLLLIEFKFIEAEFSICSSFRAKKELKSLCNGNQYYSELIENQKRDSTKKFLCGYNKFYNWTLTRNSKVINNEKVKSLSNCPFKFGLNQLWRNMLLAEQVSSSRKCDEFNFWVFSPKANDEYLWNDGETERLFREILSEQGNVNFKRIYLETIFEELNKFVVDMNDKLWLTKMEEKYNIV